MTDPITASTAFEMSDTVVHGLEAVGSLIGSALAIGFAWNRLSDRISTANAKADAAGKTASTALARVIETERELVNHRVMVAAEYVSKTTLGEMRTELLGAINRLSDQFMATFKGSH